MTKSHDPVLWVVLARDAAGFAIAASTAIIVWFRKRSARYWPFTFGNVESLAHFKDNLGRRTDFTYSYSVGNEFYSGVFQLRSWSERKANEKELCWKGRKIQVRYSPGNPQISVVRVEDQASLYGGEFTGH
jgi:Protein of unknown function (DUF3592)